MVSAPVVILAFNRPDVTKKVVERVRESQPKTVYLIADGPREDHPEDRMLCDRVREILISAGWTGEVHTNFAESNMGLRKRVVTGLDWVFGGEDRAIILEDDCLPDPSFFSFADQLLERYVDREQVGMISGNNFLRGQSVSDDSYYFSPDARIWGWATWARVWNDFSNSGLEHHWSSAEARNVVSRIQSSVRRQGLIRQAERAADLDSWALPFVLHAQRRRLLSVVPQVNLVTNIGFGVNSTHTKFESFTAEVPVSGMRFPLRHPPEVVAHPSAGRLEARLERIEWLSYPLRHPLDVIRRVWRYLKQR